MIFQQPGLDLSKTGSKPKVMDCCIGWIKVSGATSNRENKMKYWNEGKKSDKRLVRK
jgi:hypothetical protein